MNKHRIQKYIIVTIVLFLLQVFVCDHILLFGLATPIIFIFPLISLPTDFNRKLAITLGFILGLCVDIWNDTPGVNALCATLLAYLARPVFFLYMTRDDKTVAMKPSFRTMGIWNYVKYSLTLCTFYCFMVFFVEYFSFEYVEEICLKGLASTAFSFILILGIESVTATKQQ